MNRFGCCSGKIHSHYRSRSGFLIDFPTETRFATRKLRDGLARVLRADRRPEDLVRALGRIVLVEGREAAVLVRGALPRDGRGFRAAVAPGRQRQCGMAEALSIISDDAAEPRLRRVAVRRGFRLFVEVRREVGGRHVYFVERRARERADELQSLLMQRSLVSSS